MHFLFFVLKTSQIFVFISLTSFFISCSSEKSSEEKKKPETATVAKDTTKPEDVQLERAHAFERFAESLVPGAKVEVYELSWPGDDFICGKYNNSQGPLAMTVYRLAGSRKIIAVHEVGAFCQGDSDFDRWSFVNAKGALVYSTSMGIYAPNRFVFYDTLIQPLMVVETRGDGEDEYLPKLKKSDELYSLDPEDYLKCIENKKFEINARIITLQTENFVEEEEKKEAEATLAALKAEHTRPVVFKDGFVLRKAKSGESTMIESLNVPVRNAPGDKAQQIGSVSYYNVNAMVSEVNPDGWYKISFYDYATKKEMQGWIPESALVLGIFPKE